MSVSSEEFIMLSYKSLRLLLLETTDETLVNDESYEQLRVSCSIPSCKVENKIIAVFDGWLQLKWRLTGWRVKQIELRISDKLFLHFKKFLGVTKTWCNLFVHDLILLHLHISFLTFLPCIFPSVFNFMLVMWKTLL